MTTSRISDSSLEYTLTHLFSEDFDIESIICDGELLMEVNPEQEVGHQLTVTSTTEEQLPTSQDGEPAEQKERISRAELVRVLEGFVELVKNGDDLEFGDNDLSFVPPKAEITVNDATTEVSELRTLLVEAQGTIIRLLTDRVDDRARLATLQSEIRLLPDLKAQAERAMQIAFTADEFKAEFAKVKLEIEKIKLAKLRAEVETERHPWWSRLTDWMTKPEAPAE